MHPTRARSFRLSASACAALALATSASAQNATLEIEVAQHRIEASNGDNFELTVRGEPGHVPVLVLGPRRGATPLPGVGVVGINVDPQPFIMALGQIPPSGELSLSASLECGNPLITDGPVYLQVVTFDLGAGDWDQISNLEVFQLLSGDCGMCAQEAMADAYAQYPAGHALWLPGIGTDFIFTSGGQFTEREDGRARLLGVVRSKSNPSKAFAVDVTFEGRIDPLDPAHPPAMSPKLELLPSAYVANGGPVDPSNWHYYASFEGILMGLECFEGAIVAVEPHMAAFQVGLGADGKSTMPGGSGWMTYTVLEQPASCSTLPSSGHGDFNLDLCGEHCEECVEEAGDHAITLPAYGDDFLFVSGGEFRPAADGTARLFGIVQNDDDPLSRWDVDIVFSGRILPLSPSYPPPMSPKKELSSSKYVEHGGVVDTNTWHYYTGMYGRMVGLDHNAGLELELTPKGPAFQIGVGANGKNTLYGGSGWLMVREIHTNASSAGDINIDIHQCE